MILEPLDLLPILEYAIVKLIVVDYYKDHLLAKHFEDISFVKKFITTMA